MSGPIHYFLPRDIEGHEQLVALALDLQWSWSHSADEFWRQIDPELWNLTRNPWVVLQTVSRAKLKALSEGPEFRQRLAALVSRQETHAGAPAWYQQHYAAEQPLGHVAYFSMEFMLSEALPIYSGGLGNVAGDQLKASSDLGVPIVGVGLLYQQGYFRQVLTEDGAQRAVYPFNDPMQLPITPVRDESGEWVRIQIELPGLRIWLRTWQAQVGRVRLYLLDSNDPANMPAERGVISELYGGGPEVRIVQELLLGLGGYRLLCALGQRPEVCHLNEGHAAFAVLERVRTCMKECGLPFDAALAVTRVGNVFTTHTPVSAGFDRFSPDLIRRYLGDYARSELGIDVETILALGRENGGADEPFNMAYLALRGSGAVNGVSRLHGEVSRRIFQRLFPRWPEEEVPIGHVTNGIHVPSWDSAQADALWTEACGPGRWHGTMDSVGDALRNVTDSGLWHMRSAARQHLVAYARERLSRQLAASGSAAAELERVHHIFDPNALTIGFARRFAVYKRPLLLLHDPDRLARILTNAARPVQLILAGKAHPQDQAGEAMIQAWTRFIRQPNIRAHAIFLSDYDMQLTEHLVQGVDVWLNTPRRPWEASGTSGMKVLVNGGLNLSELDGWWAEAYTPEVGWALGDGREHTDEAEWDAIEAEALYSLLENEIVPSFYNRDERGLPTAWLARMRESMARLTPRFSANRTVREYVERYYLPAARAYRARSASNGAAGTRLAAWNRSIALGWSAIRFGDFHAETVDGQHEFHVQVYLGDLGPDAVRVELYADGHSALGTVREPMTVRQPLAGSVNGYLFTARILAVRPASDYTPRVIPDHPEATVPFEAVEILWRQP